MDITTTTSMTMADLTGTVATAGYGKGGGGSGGGGGKPDGAGSKKGDLYGDQYVLLRDLDPSDGGGNGEPLLDANGQPILVGTNGQPIYFVANVDGDYEIPADQLVYAQTVELERANVARAPDKVMEKSLATALGKIEAATVLGLDAAGRIVCDGATIDSPLENLALYQYLMTAGGRSSWPAVTQHWPDSLKALLGDDPTSPDWDPSSLLGAAFSKEAPISLDAVLYQNTVLGVNTTSQVSGQLVVDYFDFTQGQQESYSYDREARFEGVWLQWYADTDGDPTNLEQVRMPLLEAVFNNTGWTDAYLALSGDGSTFETAGATLSGTNDFAQAADDARAVINFMHETGAVQIEAPAPVRAAASFATGGAEGALLIAQADGGHEGHDDGHEEEGTLVMGTQFGDLIETGGGRQTIMSGNGQDEIRAGGGPDHVEAGNGKDLLMGQGGPDVLIGGNGKDVLIGGAGPDTLTGGRGADLFVYTATGDAPSRGGMGGDDHGGGDHGDDHEAETMDSTAVQALIGPPVETVVCSEDGGGRRETITDFEVAIDRIDFSALGVDLQWAQGPEAYAIWVEQQEAHAVVYVDTDGQVAGGNPAELAIVLMGVNAESLSIDNFVV